jgi:hypothetical protein
MDINGCEGIFRVSVDVYLYFCSKLELHVKATSSAFCAEVPTGSGQASILSQSYHTHRKVCALLDKAAVICEIFSFQVANRLIS